MITIIGGSGFVGSRLISHLKEFNCHNYDKNHSPFFNDITTICDIRKKETILLDSSTSTVVLLAAEHRDDVSPVSEYYKVNVEGTKNVLDKMDELGIKNLIFTSSVAVYGLNKSDPNESHKTDPFNHYGKSKWEAEKILLKWYQDNPKDKSVIVIRPTVIFGERNRGNVFNLLKQIANGRFFMIGKGQNKKSMAYVGNVVAFIKNRIEANEKGYHIYNYVDKPDLTMSELVSILDSKMKITRINVRIPYTLGIISGYLIDILAKITNKKFSISSVRIKKFCATTQFNASKAHSVFQAPFTLEEGLNNTLEHEFISPKDDDILFYTE